MNIQDAQLRTYTFDGAGYSYALNVSYAPGQDPDIIVAARLLEMLTKQSHYLVVSGKTKKVHLEVNVDANDPERSLALQGPVTLEEFLSNVRKDPNS